MGGGDGLADSASRAAPATRMGSSSPTATSRAPTAPQHLLNGTSGVSAASSWVRNQHQCWIATRAQQRQLSSRCKSSLSVLAVEQLRGVGPETDHPVGTRQRRVGGRSRKSPRPLPMVQTIKTAERQGRGRSRPGDRRESTVRQRPCGIHLFHGAVASLGPPRRFAPMATQLESSERSRRSCAASAGGRWTQAGAGGWWWSAGVAVSNTSATAGGQLQSALGSGRRTVLSPPCRFCGRSGPLAGPGR